MYRVLTISREYGSAGISTARMIDNKLGWKLLDSELIDAIVEQANVDPKVAQRFDERVDPWLATATAGTLRLRINASSGNDEKARNA